MINITQEAIEAIDEKYYLNEGKAIVRIFISGIGWGGPTFGITLDSVKENDFFKELDEFNLVIERDLLDLYGSFDIDFLDSWVGKSLLVTPAMGGSTCS